MNKLYNRKPCRNKRLRIRRERFGGLLYDAGPDHFIKKSLNKTATRILELCTGHFTTNEIANILAKEFSKYPEKLLRDVDSFLKDLEKERYISYEGTLEPTQITSNPWEKPMADPPALEAPIHVNLYLTNMCNMRCLFCNADSGVLSPSELSFDEWKTVISSVADMGVYSVTVTGGEPLLRSDTFELIDFITSTGMSADLNTNGVLIDNTIARRLGEIGARYVSISLNGASPSTHELLTGVTGSFDKTINGVKACLKAGLTVDLNFIITALNYQEIHEFLNLSKKLGADGLKFFFVLNIGRARTHPEILLTKDQLEFAYRTIVEESREEERISYEPWVVRESSYTSAGREPCAAAINRCSITADGFVTPCVFFPNIDIMLNEEVIRPDNVRIVSFEEIWRRSKYLGLIRKAEYLTAPCKTCDFKDGCRGGCRVNAVAFFGSPLIGDPNCPKVSNCYDNRHHKHSEAA